MKTNEYKSVKLSPELHKSIKNYCNTNGLKMSMWVEKQLEKLIINLNDEKKRLTNL